MELPRSGLLVPSLLAGFTCWNAQMTLLSRILLPTSSIQEIWATSAKLCICWIHPTAWWILRMGMVVHGQATRLPQTHRAASNGAVKFRIVKQPGSQTWAFRLLLSGGWMLRVGVSRAHPSTPTGQFL